MSSAYYHHPGHLTGSTAFAVNQSSPYTFSDARPSISTPQDPFGRSPTPSHLMPSTSLPVAIPTRKSARRPSDVASASSSLSSSFGGGVEKRKVAAPPGSYGKSGGSLATRSSGRTSKAVHAESPPYNTGHLHPSASASLSAPTLGRSLSSPVGVQPAFVPRSADDDGEIGAEELDGLINPKGGKRRSSSIFKCETCAKVYRHPSCLVKHRWQHTPHWQESSKLSMSKHQQVQVLEAASILFTLAPEAGTSLPEDKSLWPSAVSPTPLPRPSISYQDSRLVSKAHSTHSSRANHRSAATSPLPSARQPVQAPSSPASSDSDDLELDSGYGGSADRRSMGVHSPVPVAPASGSPRYPGKPMTTSPLANSSLGLPPTERRASFTSQMSRLALSGGIHSGPSSISRSYSPSPSAFDVYGSSPGVGVSALRGGGTALRSGSGRAEFDDDEEEEEDERDDGRAPRRGEDDDLDDMEL